MEQGEITVRKPAEQLDRRAITDLVRLPVNFKAQSRSGHQRWKSTRRAC